MRPVSGLTDGRPEGAVVVGATPGGRFSDGAPGTGTASTAGDPTAGSPTATGTVVDAGTMRPVSGRSTVFSDSSEVPKDSDIAAMTATTAATAQSCSAVRRRRS